MPPALSHACLGPLDALRAILGPLLAREISLFVEELIRALEGAQNRDTNQARSTLSSLANRVHKVPSVTLLAPDAALLSGADLSPRAGLALRDSTSQPPEGLGWGRSAIV
jgi:hypothetical protein